MSLIAADLIKDFLTPGILPYTWVEKEDYELLIYDRIFIAAVYDRERRLLCARVSLGGTFKSGCHGEFYNAFVESLL